MGLEKRGSREFIILFPATGTTWSAQGKDNGNIMFVCLFVCLFVQRQSVSGEGIEREGDTESETGSTL